MSQGPTKKRDAVISRENGSCKKRKYLEKQLTASSQMNRLRA